MGDGSSIASVVKAIVSLVRYARKKKKGKAGAVDGKPQSSWEAMILEQAGPNRSDPIVPNRQVNLGRK